MHYRVELEELLAFVDKLQAFEAKAEAIASRVDGLSAVTQFPRYEGLSVT